MTKNGSKKARKPRKRVEYRYFASTKGTGLLGGIVAGSLEHAEAWAPQELFSEHKGFKLIRVRLEYVL